MNKTVDDDGMITWTGPRHVFDALLADRERLEWILSNLWDDTIEVEGAPGSRRCLNFNRIDPDNLVTRRAQIDYTREVIAEARGSTQRSGRSPTRGEESNG